MSQAKNILITGASGLVGGHIAHYFSTSGNNIYCLVREKSNIDFIKDLPVTILHGDIGDRDKLQSLFKGMDRVIHTAARVADWGDYTQYYSINVTGTVNVLQAALQNNIMNVIITGSVSSYGEENSTILKDETFGYNSHYPYAFDRIMPSAMNHYRDSKEESTRQAVAFAKLNGMNLTVIEPAWVYGEHEFSSGFLKYLENAVSGFPFTPGCRTNTFHVIYAGDLARAYYLAFQKELKGVNRIIIGNREPENMQSIYKGFCREAGVKKPVNLPKWLVYPLALAMEGISLALKRTSPPLLTRSRVNMFYDSIGFSTARAEKILGFRNQVDLETGIRKTVQWYKKNNLL